MLLATKVLIFLTKIICTNQLRMKTIEEIVKIGLIKKKMNLVTLCEQVGLSDTAMRTLMKRNDCKISTARKIADALDIDICEFVNTQTSNEPEMGEKELINRMEAEIAHLKEIINLKDNIIIKQDENGN